MYASYPPHPRAMDDGINAGVLTFSLLTILAFVCADHPGQRLGHTGLLGNNKFHFVHPPSSKNGIKTAPGTCDPWRYVISIQYLFYRFSAQLLRESALTFEGKRLPASTSAPVISLIRAGASLPISLLPEVAKGMIFFPVKS